MQVTIKIKTVTRLSMMLFIILSAIHLTGCGGSGGASAPVGSAISLEKMGTPEYSMLNSVPTDTLSYDYMKTQKYRVKVLDADGVTPLNGISVEVVAQFLKGTNITISGATGSAPFTATFNDITGKYGFFDFAITAPFWSQTPIDPPVNQDAAGSITDGNLPDGDYYYTITSVDLQGETYAQGMAHGIISGTSVTTPAGSVSLSWKAVPGAVSYNVYSGTTSTPLTLLLNVTSNTDPVTYLDNGTYWPPDGVTLPPTSNTTGKSSNSTSGSMSAQSGIAIANLDFSF